ncbi:MAG: hypothetical protein HC880_07380 [Bacteroidia bacterium]|nr:hypothetical protein [Bacteroidia bacterium]
MNDKIKQKVEKAIDSAKDRKKEPFEAVKCPLRCWDVFAMMRHEFQPPRANRRK